jgi:moderate conductance mechanosensitive channel
MRSEGNRWAARPVLALLLLFTLHALPAWAAPAPASAAAGSKPATVAAPISAAQAQQVLEVLNDPKKRAAFTDTLTAMAKSLPVAAPAAAPAATPAAPAKVVLAPNSVGGELLGEIGSTRKLVAGQAADFGRMFGDVLLTTRWFRHELRDPEDRAVLADAAWRGTLAIAVGLLAERGLFLLLRRPLRALARDSRIVHEAAPVPAEPPLPEAEPEPVPDPAPEPDPAPAPDADADPAALAGASAETPLDAEKRARDAKHRWHTLRLLRRVPFAVLRLLLKLLPVGLFLVVGNLAGELFSDHPITQAITVTVADLYGIGRLLYLVVEMLLAPRAPGVRLLGVADPTAVLLSRWWAWLVAVPVVAVTVTEIGGILDLPQRAAQSMIRGIVLVEHVLLAVLTWRVRQRVAAALSPPRRFRDTAVGAVLARLAAHWWIPALFFNFALWLVWAAQVRDGYGRIVRLFFMTCAVILVCRLLSAALLGLLDRLFRLNPELELRFPGLERRASRYYPLLRRVVNIAVTALGAVALLQAWGLDALTWFTGGALGTRLVSALISILMALVIGVVVWEAANAALDRQVSRFDRAAQAARAVRLQTLLPILRTVLFIVLAIIIGLTVLSEIGVNVAPLLAGAGILGVAIGFGSQKLVQDFITGIFLLVENAMQVGDTVTAAGVTGTVEHLSIRTLRLRGGDGSIQIIPFSSVTTVTNLSRDFAVASISISVAFEENTDRVCDLMNAIGQQLRTEAAFADTILADFALNGVDSIGEYAVAISGSIKCTVGGRWPVQREFYRRLRTALHEKNVALPARPLVLPGIALEPETAP